MKRFNLLVLFIFIVAALMTLLFGIKVSKSGSSLEQYAQKVLTACKQVSYRPGCYNNEIPKLMDRLSMEQAFAVTKIVQEKDSSFGYCHVVGHSLSAREVKKDPSKWKEVVTRCPSGVCSNGCIHGGFQERFRRESVDKSELEAIKPELLDICKPREGWNPTGVEQGSCYHALGHLLMYLTSADISFSLDLCREIAILPTRNYSQICFDGVFMQLFQPLEPEDFALIKGKELTKEQVGAFCSQFQSNEKSSCWSESWPLFKPEITTPQGLINFCSKAPPESTDRCYSSLFYVLTVQFRFDINRLSAFCSQLKGREGQCFASVASRLIETDYGNIEQAVEFCRTNEKYDKDALCYRKLVSDAKYNFHPGSQQFYDLCNKLPDQWKTMCLKIN